MLKTLWSSIVGVKFPNARSISTTSLLNGKKNFRKFLVYNKRPTRIIKQQGFAKSGLKIDNRGVRATGLTKKGKFLDIPEMIPELVVPNLEDCQLKPYVSYRTQDVTQSEFTSVDLFNSIYAKKIMDDFKSGKLNDDGSPIDPSQDEELTDKEALQRARNTGSDIF